MAIGLAVVDVGSVAVVCGSAQFHSSNSEPRMRVRELHTFITAGTLSRTSQRDSQVFGDPSQRSVSQVVR
jgi:hypothetical protein